ncbi:hypothetical protein MDA_GLEAN10007373 [Myotis davidii]|uniref:Uncharacterized protein n=1 Tax=Myotis davidii TaxID=225400 RepID=L5LY54_MYODS|nr:hypothetical protein MDA_GLEAN10007373 [Myotis davidii]
MALCKTLCPSRAETVMPVQPPGFAPAGTELLVALPSWAVVLKSVASGAGAAWNFSCLAVVQDALMQASGDCSRSGTVRESEFSR